jgi:hypothetical protein
MPAMSTADHSLRVLLPTLVPVAADRVKLLSAQLFIAVSD